MSCISGGAESGGTLTDKAKAKVPGFIQYNSISLTKVITNQEFVLVTPWTYTHTHRYKNISSLY